MIQANYAELQLRAVGASTWGTVKGGVWYPTTSSNPFGIGSDGFVATMGNYLTAGTPYEWRVRVAGSKWDLGGITFYNWSDWSDIAQFTAIAPPEVSAVAMTSSLAPTVTWTVTGTQVSYRVRVLDSAALAVYDSGWVDDSGATAHVPQQDWTNGDGYTPEVTVLNEYALESEAVTGSAVTMAWTPPDSPTSVTVQEDARPITATAHGILATHDQVRFTWTAGDQTHSVTVPATEGDVVVAVPLAAYGVATTFSVDALNVDVDGIELWSDPTEGSGTNWDRYSYLVSDDGTSYLQVHVPTDGPDRTDTAVAATFGGLGNRARSVVRSVSQGMVSATLLYTGSLAARQALKAWIDANDVYWLRWSPERDENETYADTPATRMAFGPGSWVESRLDQMDTQERHITMPWTEQLQ